MSRKNLEKVDNKEAVQSNKQTKTKSKTENVKKVQTQQVELKKKG